MTRIDIIQKVANVIVYIFFVSMTGYTIFGKDKIANLLDEYETLVFLSFITLLK